MITREEGNNERTLKKEQQDNSQTKLEMLEIANTINTTTKINSKVDHILWEQESNNTERKPSFRLISQRSESLIEQKSPRSKRHKSFGVSDDLNDSDIVIGTTSTYHRTSVFTKYADSIIVDQEKKRKKRTLTLGSMSLRKHLRHSQKKDLTEGGLKSDINPVSWKSRTA